MPPNCGEVGLGAGGGVVNLMAARCDQYRHTGKGPMTSQAVSEPTKPNERQSGRPEDGPGLRAVPTTVLKLALIVVAWFWITRQPAQVSAEILQGLMLAGIGWLAASMSGGLVSDLRGKDAMEKLATAGHWVATLFASLIYALLVVGLLSVIWHYAGREILGFFGIKI